MATLSLIDLNLEPVSTDRLFYDQYEYCMRFELSEICCLRGLPKDPQKCYDHIENAYRRRLEWNSLYDRRINYGGAWQQKRRTVFPESTQELHGLAKALLNNNDPYKLINYGQFAFLYSNNPDWLLQISLLPGIELPEFTKAVITRPRNTVLLKNSPYSNRTYFKDVSISKAEKLAVIEFFKRQQEVRLSPSLHKWLCSTNLFAMRHMFIDHSHMTLLTLLGLICPNLVRKTVDIIEINN